MVVLLIGKYGAIGESENLSEYVKSFADDFNGNGKTEVEVYYIDYDSKEDYANYANGSDTKLTTEMQIADAVMNKNYTEASKLISKREKVVKKLEELKHGKSID